MATVPDTPGGAGAWDAALYDSSHAFVWKHGAALLEVLAPRPGERILDLGCGTGHLTAQMAAAGAQVVGIDSAPSMIEQARRLHPLLRFELADARHFAFPEPFDAVFSNAVLHWIPEPDQVAACVAAALKPGGRFVAEFGGRGNVRLLVAGLEETARRVLGAAPGSPWYFPGVAEYASVLERHNLEVTYAALFDRPTPLEGDAGLRHWVAMFGQHWLSRISPGQVEHFLQQLEDRLRPALHRAEGWYADYRRLRILARRPDNSTSSLSPARP